MRENKDMQADRPQATPLYRRVLLPAILSKKTRNVASSQLWCGSSYGSFTPRSVQNRKEKGHVRR